MSQHTAAPWTLEDGPHNGVNIIGDDARIATLPFWPIRASEQLANARLIAQAPAMADENWRLRKALSNLVANEHGAESVKALCFAEARALLAEIEG